MPNTAIFTSRNPVIKRQQCFDCLQTADYIRDITLRQAFDGLLDPGPEFKSKMFGIAEDRESIERIFSDIEKTQPELLETKVKGLKGIGDFALVFQTEDNKALKITKCNHMPKRPYESFDVPMWTKGSANETHFYIEKHLRLADSDDIEAVNKMAAIIKSRGYQVRDLSLKQIGFSEDNILYLLDPQCAVKKPYIKRMFSNLLNKLKGLKR